jgi:hypothetical protein
MRGAVLAAMADLLEIDSVEMTTNRVSEGGESGVIACVPLLVLGPCPEPNPWLSQTIA